MALAVLIDRIDMFLHLHARMPDKLQLIDDYAYEVSNDILGVVEVAVTPQITVQAPQTNFIQHSIEVFRRAKDKLRNLLGHGDEHYTAVLSVYSDVYGMMMQLRAGVAQRSAQTVSETSSTSFAHSTRPTPTCSYQGFVASEAPFSGAAAAESQPDSGFRSNTSQSEDLGDTPSCISYQTTSGETHPHPERSARELTLCAELPWRAPRCLSLLGNTPMCPAELEVVRAFDPDVHVSFGPHMLLEELVSCFPEMLHITLGTSGHLCFFAGSGEEKKGSLSVTDLCAIICQHLTMPQSRLRCIFLNCDSAPRFAQHFIDTGVDCVIHWSRRKSVQGPLGAHLTVRVTDELAFDFASRFFGECRIQDHLDYRRCFIRAAADEGILDQIKWHCMPALNGQVSEECFQACVAAEER